MKIEDIKTILIIVLLCTVVFLITYLYSWLIAFRNLCSFYCASIGYKQYTISDFSCKCIGKKIYGYKNINPSFLALIPSFIKFSMNSDLLSLFLF